MGVRRILFSRVQFLSCLFACLRLIYANFLDGIGIYDTLNYTKFHQSTELEFSAFGHIFKAKIYPDLSVFSQNVNIFVSGVSDLNLKSEIIENTVTGFLTNYPNSVIFGTVFDGIFRGTLATNRHFLDSKPFPVNITEGQEGIYYIEPSGNFFKHYPGFHSIIYRGNNDELQRPGTILRKKRNAKYFDGPWFCGLSDPKISKQMLELSSPIDGLRITRSVLPNSHSFSFKDNEFNIIGHFSTDNIVPHLYHPVESNVNSSFKKQSFVDGGPTSRVCNLYLQSDTFLWNHVINLPHIRGVKNLAIKEIASIFTQHVQGAQAIFQYTKFKDTTGRHRYHGVSFRVDRVLINITEEDCRPLPLSFRHLYNARPDNRQLPSSPFALPRTIQTHPDFIDLPPLKRGSYAIHNPFCVENVDVTNFLNLNSYVKHDDFCLAYVFTYRDFSGGTLGLAWVAEAGGSGGVCEKHRLMREGSQTVMKSLNTGVVTLLNYGSRVSGKISQLTFAHEMGHNLGAKHDDDFKEQVPSCLPSVDDPKGNYIMFASATGGDKENNNKFSTCSSNSIARQLTQILKGANNCFLTSNGSFCGNRLAEEGEQCDCGFTREECDDICCHPKESSAPCNLTKTVIVASKTLKVHCSPTAGECCTPTCQYRDSRHLCRGAGECYESSFCVGTSARCPPPKHLDNGTPCKNFTKICKSGECIGSICERIPGWQECSLIRGDPKVSPEIMCYVACRQNVTGAPCISTIQLERDRELRVKYATLAKALLFRGEGIRLQPGTPCDNYRGYCDMFLRCQSVEAEGPLARLRNLLFSPKVLGKVKRWITIYWWAMLLISFGAVIAMILFMKLCSYRTPSSIGNRPYAYAGGLPDIPMMRVHVQNRLYSSHNPHTRLTKNPNAPIQNPKAKRNSNPKFKPPASRCRPKTNPANNLETTSHNLTNDEAAVQQLHLLSKPISFRQNNKQHVPSFLLKRRRLVNSSANTHTSVAVEPVSEYIPSSSVAIPYQRRQKNILQQGSNPISSRPTSMLMSSKGIPMLPSHATNLIKSRPTSFIAIEITSPKTCNGQDNSMQVIDESTVKITPGQPGYSGAPPHRGTPPPMYS